MQEEKRMSNLEELVGEPIFTIPNAAKKVELSQSAMWIALRERRIGKTKILGKTYIRLSELRKLVVDEKAE